MTFAQRIAVRIRAARRLRANVLVVESTGVTWRPPAQISRKQLQNAADRRLAK